MHNHWGGSFEINNGEDDEKKRNNQDWDRASIAHQHSQNLDETQQSWLLGPVDHNKKKKDKYIDLGCILCSKKLLKWTLWGLAIAFLVIAVPIIIAKSLPKHKHKPPPPDNYTLALHKALLFFNAQKYIAAKSPLVVIGTKRVLLQSRDLTVDQGLDYVATWNSGVLLSDDLSEATAAQQQKRKPRFAKL